MCTKDPKDQRLESAKIKLRESYKRVNENKAKHQVREIEQVWIQNAIKRKAQLHRQKLYA